jgi:Heavy-metal resistance
MTISTDTETARRSEPRRPRLIEIALVLSLALNCFIIGGVATTAWRFHHPPPPPTEIDAEAIADAAGLSPAETADLLAVSRAARLDSAIMRSLNAPLLNSYLNELAKDNPDGDSLEKIEVQIRKNRDDMRIKIAREFYFWFKELDAGKRRFILSKIRNPRDPMTYEFRKIIGFSPEQTNPP